MNILSYIDVLVNIKASALIYTDKGVFIFDFLRNAPYFIKLKRILPGTSLSSTRSGEGPLDLPTYKAIFVKLIKLVIIIIRVYKDIPQGKLEVNFRDLTQSRA